MNRSSWLLAIRRLKEIDAGLPAVFPPELPPESSPQFWFRVAELEMRTRDTLSAKLRSLIRRAERPAMSAWESWMVRRRSEWAAQLILAKVEEGVEPDASLDDILQWLLIESWESDGCVAMWNHAERGGAPHPGNPDGLSPLP